MMKGVGTGLLPLHLFVFLFLVFFPAKLHAREYFVTLKSNLTSQQKIELRQRFQATRLELRTPLYPNLERWQMAHAPSDHPHILSYDENKESNIRTVLPPSGRSPQPGVNFDSSLRSNDPFLNEQWGLVGTHGIRMPSAWTYGQGSKEVIVAIIDTGVDTSHPDLQGQLWVNKGEIPNNGIDDDENGYVDDIHGYNYLQGHGDVADDDGHGTHVAGIIGAQSNNQKGIAGINWNVKLMILRAVPGKGTEKDHHLIEAFHYATVHGAKIINCSFAKTAGGQAVADTITILQDHGVLVVAASGNETQNLDKNPVFPAAFPNSNILTVAATQEDGHIVDWSNTGKKTVDMAAPGVDILSTILDGEYDYWSGTSFAAPMVTGVAAWAHSLYELDSAVELKQYLMESARPVASHKGLTKSASTLDATGLIDYLDRRLANF